MTLEGKTVLITGANRGIGQALAQEALERGAARVYAATRQPVTHLAGPVDTQMSKYFVVPKASPESAAAAIFAGVADGAEEISPDPAAQQLAAAWTNGAAKVLERSYADLPSAS